MWENPKTDLLRVTFLHLQGGSRPCHVFLGKLWKGCIGENGAAALPLAAATNGAHGDPNMAESGRPKSWADWGFSTERVPSWREKFRDDLPLIFWTTKKDTICVSSVFCLVVASPFCWWFQKLKKHCNIAVWKFETSQVRSSEHWSILATSFIWPLSPKTASSSRVFT